MSPRLTRPALQDIDTIRDYTVQTWGRDQWLRYFAGLAAAFDLISADPGCGRPRDLFRAKMRSLAFEKHLIFFIPAAHADGAPVILRIMHQRQNMAALIFYEDLEG